MDENSLNHVAVIPDGNRRWAKAQGRFSLDGHLEGTKRAVEISRKARELGIHTLTFWGLSTENFTSRAGRELNYLMRLFADVFDTYLKDALADGVRLIHLGRKDRLPDFLIKRIADTEEKTKNFDKYVLNIGLDYGGQDEIIRATKALAKDVSAGRISTEAINEETYKNYLDTRGQLHPFPDLVIRTSGEMRTSGLLPFQIAYSELYFEPAFFPDFGAEKFSQALNNYRDRQRNFGR